MTVWSRGIYVQEREEIDMQVVYYRPIIHLLIVIDQIRDINSYYCYGISLK